MENLFVYGTLRKPELRGQLTGRNIPGRLDKIQGFKLSTVNYGENEYPALKEESTCKDSIEGEVIEVTESELKLLDQYEGELYQRKKFTLESGLVSWIYVGLG